MPYLGRPLISDKTTKTKKIDNIASSFNGAQTVFSLNSSGTAVYPASSRNLFVSINGVLQEPDVAYTINAATITFTSAPTTNATFFCVVNGEPNDLLLAPSVTTLSLGSTTITGTGFTSGANVTMNTSTLLIGNSTSNTVITSGVVNTGNVNIVGVTSLQEILEKITISATAATGTIAFDALTQGVLYYTTNASANWTLNLRGNSTVTLNTVMSTGQSLTVAFLVSQGATAYYASAHQVDGNSVTPKWQGGTAPTSGNINSVDIYSYTVVKTASSTFTVFASQTKFA